MLDISDAIKKSVVGQFAKTMANDGKVALASSVRFATAAAIVGSVGYGAYKYFKRPGTSKVANHPLLS